MQCRFGTCPRVWCNKQRVLPGQSLLSFSIFDTPSSQSAYLMNLGPIEFESTVPNVKNAMKLVVLLYILKSRYYYFVMLGTGVDGAFFGTSFPAIFLQTYPAFVRYHKSVSIFLVFLNLGPPRSPATFCSQNFWIQNPWETFHSSN